MQSGFALLLLLIVPALMHWKFVDMWFSAKGGLKWFWRAPSPPLSLTLARLSFVAMLVVLAIAMSLPSSPSMLVMSGALIFSHLGLLVYISERPR